MVEAVSSDGTKVKQADPRQRNPRARGRAAVARKAGRGETLRIALASYADDSQGVIPLGDYALRGVWEGWGHSVSQVIWSNARVPWHKFDLVVIRSCWDYHLRSGEFRNWITRLEQLRVPLINPAPLIRWNLDKRYLRDLHLPMPKTIWLGEGEAIDVERVCAENGWAGAVVKPWISASAHQTRRCDEGVAEGPVMLQEFVPEIQSAGEWSLIFLGGLLSHAVLKHPAGDDFRVQQEFGGRHQPGNPPPHVAEFARRALERMPLPAAIARVDIVESAARGPLLMELELIEPELFFPPGGTAHEVAAQAVLQYGQRNFRP